MSKAMTFPWARPLVGLALVFLLSPIVPARADNGLTNSSDGMHRTRDASNQKVRIHIPAGQAHCLRAAVAGVRTRNSSSPTARGIITLPAAVTPGSVVWAGLYWTILADAPTANAVTLNGAPVAPVALPVTMSPCWMESFAFAWFADVTALVVPGANLVDGLDDSGSHNVSPESEGASLVVIYRALDSSACEIIVTDGNDLVNITGQVIDNPLPVTCGTDIPASLYFIGGDGQPAGDNQVWNGVALGDGDDFDASDPATPPPDYVGWDTDGWAVLTAPPNTATLATEIDCINWVATVLEVGVRPEICAVPAEKSTWGRMKSQYR